MQVKDFSFELPEQLIARFPKAERSSSRLLKMQRHTGELSHLVFTDVLSELNPGDLLVFNNTRVIPARLFGQKESGGKVEILVERVLDTQRFLAHVRASKAPKADTLILLDEQTQLNMLQRHDTLFELELLGEEPLLQMLDRLGHMPLPPYIDRPDSEEDKHR